MSTDAIVSGLLEAGPYGLVEGVLIAALIVLVVRAVQHVIAARDLMTKAAAAAEDRLGRCDPRPDVLREFNDEVERVRGAPPWSILLVGGAGLGTAAVHLAVTPWPWSFWNPDPLGLLPAGGLMALVAILVFLLAAATLRRLERGAHERVASALDTWTPSSGSST